MNDGLSSPPAVQRGRRLLQSPSLPLSRLEEDAASGGTVETEELFALSLSDAAAATTAANPPTHFAPLLRLSPPSATLPPVLGLPRDVLAKVFVRLSPLSLAKLAQTGRGFRDAISAWQGFNG